MHARTTNNKCYCACSIDIGADVALSAVINIQTLKLHLNFGSLFKCMTFVPDIPLVISPLP